MSTAYSIYRFAKPTKQELSKIDYFEPYESFPVFDAEGMEERDSMFGWAEMMGWTGRRISPKQTL